MRALCFYLGLACVTGATLMLQLTQTRLLSVVTWYHLAFLAISMAMFGLTAGAATVYLRRDRYTPRTLSFDLAHNAAAFAVSTVLAFAVQTTITMLTGQGLTVLMVWIEITVLLAVPFYFSGVVVTLALTRSPYPIGRVYAADLAGAAAGCFGVIGLLDVSSGPAAVIWTAVVAAIGAALLARSGIGHAPKELSGAARLLRWRKVWVVLLAALALLNTLDRERQGLYPAVAKGRIEIGQRPWAEAWNSYSRVTAAPPVVAAPYLWGPSPTFDASGWRLPQSMLTIDADAGTVAYGIRGDLERVQFLRYDVTNLAYHLPERNSAAVIGVGGGRDVVGARVFDVPRVVGVELNPVFVDLLMRHPEVSAFVGLAEIGGVDLIVDEARSWFARSEDRFDLIEMSLVDTWPATGAGAFTLSENGLYTLEAWRIFLRHLAPGGVYTVSRWYSPSSVAQTGRMVSLAVAALADAGVTDVGNHIYMAASGNVATIVLSPAGFSAAELQSLREAAGRLEFTPLIVPGEAPALGLLRDLMAARGLDDLEARVAQYPLDMSPPRDARPFFFNQLPLYDLSKLVALASGGDLQGVWQGNLMASKTLAVLFLVSLWLVMGAIIVPLRPTLNDIGGRLATAGTAYFALLGIGFMLVEIALLQRFSVFLGHPVYSLAGVLFALILATGVGSLLSDRVVLDRPAKLATWALVTAGYLLALAHWLPPVLQAQEGAGLAVRGLVTLATVAPAGLLMGFGFPTGMRLVSAVDARPTPWFFGINGACGVLASAFAVACSIAYGIDTTLTIGAVCYLLLIAAALLIGVPRHHGVLARPARAT